MGGQRTEEGGMVLLFSGFTSAAISAVLCAKLVPCLSSLRRGVRAAEVSRNDATVATGRQEEGATELQGHVRSQTESGNEGESPIALECLP